MKDAPLVAIRTFCYYSFLSVVRVPVRWDRKDEVSAPFRWSHSIRLTVCARLILYVCRKITTSLERVSFERNNRHCVLCLLVEQVPCKWVIGSCVRVVDVWSRHMQPYGWHQLFNSPASTWVKWRIVRGCVCVAPSPPFSLGILDANEIMYVRRIYSYNSYHFD